MRNLTVFLLFTLLFTACQDENTLARWGLIDFDRDTFERERAAWEASGITNYAVTESFSLSYVGYNVKARITVRDGVIEDKKNLTEWELEHTESIGADGPAAFRVIKTVPAIYNYVEEEIKDFCAAYHYDEIRLHITISYDEEKLFHAETPSRKTHTETRRGMRTRRHRGYRGHRGVIRKHRVTFIIFGNTYII